MVVLKSSLLSLTTPFTTPYYADVLFFSLRSTANIIIPGQQLTIMGTRGLKIVRFRGRYFVYWNQYDSYPEVVDQRLVDQIPSDPEQYKRVLNFPLLQVTE
jgi:hypothetical protein